MYRFELPSTKLKYSYLVGNHTVGIITPSRKRYEFSIHEVSGRPEGHRLPGNDGSTDSRLHPNEIAAFVVARNLR